MSRVRLFLTIVALGIGTSMAAQYLKPDKLSEADRFTAQRILQSHQPANSPNLAVEALEPAAKTAFEQPAPIPSPTVALPSGPLLRSATGAPPIDTSSLDPTIPVRHDPNLSPGLSAQTSALSIAEQIPIEAQPAPIARPAVARRSNSRSTTAQSNRSVEQLFINPLGTR